MDCRDELDDRPGVDAGALCGLDRDGDGTHDACDAGPEDPDVTKTPCTPECEAASVLDCDGLADALLVSGPGSKTEIDAVGLGPSVTDDCIAAEEFRPRFDPAASEATHPLTCENARLDPETPVTRYATDGDGNQSACMPTECDSAVQKPVCVNDRSIQLGPDGTFTLYASDLIATPTADCSPPVGYFIDRSGRPENAEQSSLAVDCSGVGATGPAEGWAWNAVGNGDFCES